ncbi:TPA: DUF551 domain-containing protein [Klebsiella pneumoniae]
MTKSTITRERLKEIINLACKTCSDGSIIYPKAYSTVGSKEVVELARMALAAFDSEPHTDDELSNLLWYSQEATCHSDPNYYCEFQRLATPGLIAGIIRELQERRKADSEPVAWLLSGGGTKNVVCFDSGNAYADPLREVTPLYRHAQPAPVVPPEQHWEELCRQHPDMSIGDAIIRAAWWNHCRAAMLHAGTLTNEGTIQAVNSPVIPGWIPVSERMPEREVDVQVYCPDKKEQMVAYLERNELEGYFRFATWRTGEGIYCQPTHWMPLPAGPKEDINALIPLVSRNEQEVK